MKTDHSMKKQDQYVWLRLGDFSSYEMYDDVEGVAEMMREADVKAPLHQGHHGQVYADGYSGANYISLYWGNRQGDWKKNLTKTQMREIEKVIGK